MARNPPPMLACPLTPIHAPMPVKPAKVKNKLVVNDFRKDCLRELKKIKLAWPGLNYATAPGVLILLPSTPVISPSPETRHLVE